MSSQPAGGAPAKPAAAAKAAAPAEVWSSPLLAELEKRFAGAIREAVVFRKMPCITVAKEFLLAICRFLKGEAGGDYTLLTDETAVDYPKREKRFEIIYHLYSFKRNDRLRLKVVVGEGETVPSVVSIWPTANWLEREVYDMFGVVYDGHPDLKRILLPDGWTGHPLRKDYDILRQDDAWVKSNLGIESGQ
jgi:NADH-quinone oxidoreductase subunit C